jgi:hypothetical protein
MATSIKQVHDLKTMLAYFAEKLNWRIDVDSFDDIEDITYGFDACDIGLKAEEFSKIASLRQLRPLVDDQPWGVFAVEFDSKRFHRFAKGAFRIDPQAPQCRTCNVGQK